VRKLTRWKSHRYAGSSKTIFKDLRTCKVPEVTMRSASSTNSQNGEVGGTAQNVLWFVEIESVISYGAALVVKFVPLFWQPIFRNSKTGFVKLWSSLTKIISRNTWDEFMYYFNATRITRGAHSG
jgi:hypothetical protein